jgi:predicted RNase H-like nuclease
VTTKPWRHVGVDWDSGGWVAVGYSENGEPGVETYTTFETLWEEHGDTAERIVVDIPIGVCGVSDDADGRVEYDECHSRRCDRLARKVIGPRSSSVFPAPCRAAVEAAMHGDRSYSELSEINRDEVDKGLTRQAASIIPGIIQVDTVLAEGASDDTIAESHPEVCFRAFAEEDLQYHKATAQGMATRLDAMAASTEYEPDTWRVLASTLDEDEGVGVDDLVDALGLALTARADHGTFHTLPDTEPIPTDAAGRPMRMCYRRAEPFDVE